ncbi:hypothetical protein BBK36DRAFT_1175374 [Trichoderma citrinoviride]|uniref:Histone deacetylase complex subunit SAP30 Sin3 binding domain-containing protein n=1 Tax=Trichoderma citrinoviride TaxID=58853 RepID=A0A2T4BN53_9HYPO|nr:hypothetical protein BBK36DRAFT_1175374 [Trichoderma citrinoviride]PTB70748.1 hypothetical protein BBK36DRAFT_1175374 [Trichoderma citrinoviride]
MAPTKNSRKDHDDHKGDAPAKEKNHGSAKMRRGASQQQHAASRELPPAPTSAPAQPTEPLLPSLPWSSFERRSLHAYVREHELTTPASYSSSFHNWVLSRPGSLGLHSPTMVRKQQIKRQSKDQLALAVRKHFNGLGIQENDVIVDFIYKVRNHQSPKKQAPTKQALAATD